MVAREMLRRVVIEDAAFTFNVNAKRISAEAALDGL